MTTPLTVLTGFLGAGKSTLLNHLLRQPELAGTAVLINEFGKIGIDHLLVERLSDTTILLNAGCLCCTIRGDLVQALRDLQPRIDSGQVTRIVVETTGLADPAPILQTLMGDAYAATRTRLDGIVTVVDAVHALHQLETHPEAAKQAAIADRIVLTKTDLSPASPALLARLDALNPAAPRLIANHGQVDPAALLDAAFDPASKTPDVTAWLNVGAYHHHHAHAHAHDSNRHGTDIEAFCMEFARPLHWSGVGTWLEMLLATQGDRLLRIKAILNLEGQDRPVAIHGIQHLLHPPSLLAAWPDHDPRTSRIVMITRGIDPAAIRSALAAFEEAALAEP